MVEQFPIVLRGYDKESVDEAFASAQETVDRLREQVKADDQTILELQAQLQEEKNKKANPNSFASLGANAFSGFGANGLSVVNSIDGEQHDSAAEAETPAESHDESGETVAGEPEVTFDEDVVSDEQQNNDDFEEPSEDEQSDQGEEAQEEQNND